MDNIQRDDAHRQLPDRIAMTDADRVLHRQRTSVAAAELPDLPDASAQRARCDPREWLSTSTAAPTIYVVDNNASVRRSLVRLLASVNLPVRTFASAEAFLAVVDESCDGCQIVDVQLAGMGVLELQGHVIGTCWRLPIIAMSGSTDRQVEIEALRRGAQVFLRKAVGAEVLIDAIASVRVCQLRTAQTT